MKPLGILARAAVGATLLLGGGGCLAENMYRKPVDVAPHDYSFQGESLTYFEGTLTDEDSIKAKKRPPGYSALPIALFIEGDGGQCQRFDQGAWFRFLVGYTGRSYVLVRPKSYANATCGTDKWRSGDFASRVEEVGVLLASLKRDHPGQPIVLVGHSAGATIAALAAQKHPGEIAAIVDMAGGTDDLSKIMKESERKKGLGAAELSENERLMDAAFEHLKSPDPDKPLWGRTEKFWSQILSMETRDLWLKTDVPVLVLHGEGDDAVPFSLMPKAKRELNRAGKDNYTWIFLEGADHDLLDKDVFILVDRWIKKKIGKAARPDDD